jgi:uncharacterized membrane protein
MSTETPPPPVEVVEDRTVAILSYVTLIGFIIAIVMHSGKKTALGAYHLRQVLGLFVTGIVAVLPCAIIAMIPLIGLIMVIVWPLLMLTFFVFWVLGLITAAKGEMKPMPVLGEHYQKWFAGAFA